MTNLYLVRHGEAVANVSGIVGGMRGDTGLTPLGVVQAERLRDRLAQTGEILADVLLASTFPRARQTAEIVAPALGLSIELDEDVQELRPGEADGMTFPDAMAKYAVPDFERDPFRPVSPGGESYSQFMFRVCRTVDRLVREHEGKTIVVFTHGGFIDGTFVHLLGMNALSVPATQLSTRHTSVTHWRHKKRWNQTAGWHLVQYNDSAHLRDIDAPARIPWADLARSRSSKG
jgi:probable phosphoglycerate mutase